VDDQILASEESFGTVTVCQGGIVHVHLPHCSLKFLPADFVKFCELMARARSRFAVARQGTTKPLGGKPRLQIVCSETPDDPECSTPPNE
jgi:hypothetical protein